MLVGDLHGARSWWIDFSTRQRELFGRWVGPRYDETRTTWLGTVDILLGIAFLLTGVLT
jgi:hypothetical protein